MRKTIYVNGIVVGDVEVTGDVGTDIELIRQFLQSRGIQREVTLVQAMFRQALSFCTTAAHLYERDLRRPPANGLSVAPFVVNSAFAIELYLKTLHQLEGAPVRGHSLLQLYDGLPDDSRQNIVDIARIHGPSYQVAVADGDVFRQFVAELDNAFTDWRYCYETGQTGTVHLQPAILVMKALDEACRSKGAT